MRLMSDVSVFDSQIGLVELSNRCDEGQIGVMKVK